MTPRPVLVVGDAPNLQNGLGRITRDLTTLLWDNREALGIDVAQLGWGYDGSPWPWRVFPLVDGENWGAGDIQQTLLWHAGQSVGPPAVVFTVWDPSRCYPITQVVGRMPQRQAQVELWGYFPIDSHNRTGAIGGPAQEALHSYDQVLGYVRFGAEVLAKSLKRSGGKGEADAGEVDWLPHGLDELWQPQEAERVQHRGEVTAYLNTVRRDDLLVGVVAANQPRKDFGLVFETVSRMRDEFERGGGNKRTPSVKLWINTDRVVSKSEIGWALPELAATYGWNNPRMLVTRQLADAQLASLYRRCGVTLAPGLGEGFCYPIAESLGCGTPVIHGAFGGGREIISNPRWVVGYGADRVEGPYALVRPVYDPELWATRALEAAAWKREEPEACAAYCSGSVEHLRWGNLKHAWVQLFESWLAGSRRR